MMGFKRGDVIADRYLVKRLIGKGGMGEVYLVLDQRAKRHVALKTIRAQYATHPKAVGRFVREVKTVRKMHHPGIVRIYEARKHGDLLFYTMEYLQGRSLRTWMQEKRRFSLRSTVRVLTMLSEILEHAHQFTIHRDISPENIFVLGDGTVKLLDFGLAKLDIGGQALTRIGTSLGKLQYSAPEQQTDAKNVGPRADIYSLGVLFYEMLTGELPKPGQPLSRLAPGLPQECDTFVGLATAKDPEQRFPSATAFREALQRIHAVAQQRERAASKPPPPIPPLVAPAPPASIWRRLRDRLIHAVRAAPRLRR